MNITLLSTLLGISLEHSHQKMWITIAVPTLDAIQWLGLLELPILIATLFTTFLISTRFNHIKFGDHLMLLFWGIILISLGQLRMESAHLFHNSTLHDVFGHPVSEYLWYIVISITWGIPTLGFYKIYTIQKL